jgi:dipeptidyl aminopeptidase/acylaminoacyl peptidase
MPWDSSELVVAPYTAGEVGAPVRVAGGSDESVTQPYWAGDGRLWFVSDRTGWCNLYAWDGQQSIVVAPVESEVAPPQWEAGYASYVPLPGGGVVMSVLAGPRHRLEVHDEAGRRTVGCGYTSVKPYLAVDSGRLLAIAASPTQPPRPVSIDLTGREGGQVLAPDLEPAQEEVLLSRPEILTVSANGGTPITAVLYPPVGASPGWSAPLVVRAHPGPTSSISLRLDWHVQFLTSQGFAVVDVDYRGSAGYGRAFRRSLYGQWGTADVQDCARLAQHLLEAGRTRPGLVFISGASAGGYTALQAVSGPSLFSGAVARSAIVDPRRWRQSAPRWQRPHAAALLGPAGAVDPAAITRPVLLIHSASDHVAPLADVTALADRLAARDHRHELIVLGAGKHLLSARQEAARALGAEVDFYRAVTGG